MDEILSKKFDELTPEGGFPACTACSSSLGADGETRDSYDDVDDYNDSCGAPTVLTDALGNSPANYDNYSMEVCVFYDDNYDGIDDGATGNAAKLITVNIYLPAGAGIGSAITFSAYKGNY
jgi:MSHA pilin protein MshD